MLGRTNRWETDLLNSTVRAEQKQTLQRGHLIDDNAATAKSPQSCPTLCNPIDGSPPGCPVPGILQARTLEWVAISFSNTRKWKVKVKSLSRVRPLAIPWTVAYQAPPSMGVSRQEYWSGVPFPSSPNPRYWFQGHNGAQVLDASSQKEFSERQRDR